MGDRKWAPNSEVWQQIGIEGHSFAWLSVPPTTRKCGPGPEPRAHAHLVAQPIKEKRGGHSGGNSVCKQEVWHSSYRSTGECHGGLRAGPKGTPEAERRRRAGSDQAEEEKEGQRQSETPGSNGNEQKERGGEAARPGQADPGPGGLRENAGEAGLQQTPGHTHGALRHSQSQLDEVAACPQYGAASRVRKRPHWGCVCFLWYILETWLHTPLHLLLQTAFRSCVPSFWNLIKVRSSLYSV
eukprot:XP_011526200.1 protein FAM32A isoform X1 [Homo sapiens]